MVEKIITSPDAILPKEGLWGFVLGHWLAIALGVMVLGFVIDQVLFIVRYRPQDKWKAIWNRLCGKPVEEDEEEENPLMDTGYTVQRAGENPSTWQAPRNIPNERAAYQAPVKMPEERTVYQTPQRMPEERTVYQAPKKEMPGHLPHKTMEKPENLVTDRLHRPVREQGDEPVIVRGQFDANKFAGRQDDFSPEDDAPIVVRAVKMPEEEPITKRP